MVYFHPLTKAACKKTTPPYIGYVDLWPDTLAVSLGFHSGRTFRHSLQ
jgi:hypothetical protein